jgi:predicted acetyltransferase
LQRKEEEEEEEEVAVVVEVCLQTAQLFLDKILFFNTNFVKISWILEQQILILLFCIRRRRRRISSHPFIHC